MGHTTHVVKHKNAYRVFVGDHLDDVCVLKCTAKKQDGAVWTVFIRLKLWTSGGVLSKW